MEGTSKKYQHPVFASTARLSFTLVLIGLCSIGLSIVEAVFSDTFHVDKNQLLTSESNPFYNIVRLPMEYFEYLEWILILIIVPLSNYCLYLAHRNLEALGNSNLKFSHKWTIIWWYIPIYGLWKPYQIVKEIWKGSDPEQPVQSYHLWNSREYNILILTWFIPYILMWISLVGFVLYVFLADETLNMVIELVPQLQVLTNFLATISEISFAWILVQIGLGQNIRYQKMFRR